MNDMTPLWLGLALLGFIVGLWVRPVVLLRIAIGLFLLGGLGLLVCNLMGFPGAAYWFGVGMIAVAVMFGVAIVGALAGALVRRVVRRGEEPQAAQRRREYNSIIQ